MQKATVDQPVTHPHGALLITTALVETGIHFYVSDGVQRIDELTKTFADREQAKAYYLHVSRAAEQGKRIHQIVWEVQALEEAQNAATGRSTGQVKTDLNTDGAAYLAAETEVHNQLVRDTAQIMADADPNWRANLRKQVVQAVNANPGSLGSSVRRSNDGRSATGQQVCAAITSEPMDRIIAEAANGDGYIPRSKQATSVQLIALDRRGLVRLRYTGPRIAGGWLTVKGYKHAGVVSKEIAA